MDNKQPNKMEQFFDKNKNALLYISMFVFLVLALLSFDAKLSTGGDDASYIVRAMRLIKSGRFPTFQGPLYPIFLSPFVALFGIKVGLLKMLSVVLGLGALYFFFISFKNRISSTVLMLTILLLSVNSYFIHYASQTYSEMFHIFLQCIFTLVFFRVVQKLGNDDTDIKKDYKTWLLLAFVTVLVVLSKNIGLALVISVPFFFLIHKQFKAAFAFLVSYGAIYYAYTFIRDLIWDVGSHFSKQGNVFLYKDPYNFSKGKEELSGYFQRLYDNTHIYLSKNFMKIMNLRESDVTDIVELFSYVLLGLFIIGFIRSLKKKNKFMIFTFIFTAATLLITFVILQKRWDSDRLIVIMIPYMVIALIYTFHQLITSSKRKFLRPVFYIAIVLLIFSNFTNSVSKVDLLATKKNLEGDRYYGYTPDWVNYLKMSEWVSENLAEDELVAARKQTMSIIFSGGREFHSIGRVPSNDADSLLNIFREKNVQYVIMASLRRNPKVKSEYTINTVHRYLSIIEQKYPGTFLQVHEIGKSEPARLFRVIYR